VSNAYYTAVHNVLTGQEDAETALALLELDLEALTGFETGAP
jgi:trehalose/maltose transport system substrate-binding protein